MDVAATTDLRIAIGAAPSTALSLENEIRLLKPALLYADRVTLCSPATSMLAMTAGLGDLSEDQKLDFLRQLIPTIRPSEAPGVLDILNLYTGLRTKRRRSREEIIAVERLRRQLERTWTELRQQIDELLVAAGADQLMAAIEADLLEVDLLESGENFDLDSFMQVFVDRLASMLTSENLYPLFDDIAGALVQAQIAEGLIEPSEESTSRGKQVAAASDFMSRLPAFPAASIAEILDVRDELREPLVRFRAGMVSVADLLHRRSYEPEFREELREAYVEHVAPALQEMQEAVRANAFLRKLLGEAVGDMKTIVTGVVTLGVTHAAKLPPLIAGGAALVTAAAKAAWDKSQEARRIREQHFYFLYRTEELLS